MAKNAIIFITILIASAVGLATVYYFGYDHGWERAVKQSIKSNGSADKSSEGGISLCVDQCGNSACEEIVCQGTGLPLR